MSNYEDLKQWINKPFKVYHAETFPLETNPMTYFALTDALVQYAGEFQQPMIYFWPTTPMIFLGMVDTKLPYFHSALPNFSANGYQYVVRNSGGLAVVSDPGVLNFSIIFPERKDRLTIDEAYERMFQLISAVLNPYSIKVDAYEIEESYCPGDFDLSINGKKIAGIAQRRISGGISVMIYLSINGNQPRRTEMIRDFYDSGLQGEEVNWEYPDINPSVMTTIQEAAGTEVSVNEIIERIIQVIGEAQSTESLEPGEYTDFILSTYKEAYNKMVKRNIKLLGESFNGEEIYYE